MLKSFVSEEDYPILVDIVRKIKSNTFEDTSILQIYGGPASGKTTFLEFLEKLSGGDRVKLDPNLGLPTKWTAHYYAGPNNHLLPFQKNVAFCNSLDEYNDAKPLETLAKYHRMINTCLRFRILYEPENFREVKKPATLVVAINEKYDISLGEIEREYRTPMYLHFPNRFDCKTPIGDIVDKCLEEAEKL